MDLFGRLKEYISAKVLPVWSTPSNEAPTAKPNTCGKRPRSPSVEHKSAKRVRRSGANITEHRESSDEWSYVRDMLATPKPRNRSGEASSTKELMAHLESPEYKRHLAKDKLSVQPDKQFDESDLKPLDLNKVRAQRWQDAQEMRASGWAEDPIEVYVKLAMRGWEPLFPQCWRLSFDSFPRVLFAQKAEDEHIKALSENQFRGMKAFRSLVTVASRARDATLMGVDSPYARKPQELIRRETKSFIKWAFDDAGLSDTTPTLAVISGPVDAEPKVLERRMIKRLTRLKQEWVRDMAVDGTVKQRTRPAIYGIIVSGLILCLVALEDEVDGYDEPRIRAFSWNNMGQPEYDVWTSISIAILVMHCRNRMLDLVEMADEGGRQQPSQQTCVCG